MRRFKASMPRPAMIVACVALIAALGGTAYAAVAKNSVGTNQIRPGSVKTDDLGGQAVKARNVARDAVRTNRILDGSVTNAKLGDRQVNLAKLGITVVTHFADAPLPDDGTVGVARAQCAAGEIAISGGSSFNVPSSAPMGTTIGTDIQLIASRPSIIPEAPNGFPAEGSGFNAWRVSARNATGGPTPAIEVTSLVVCLKDTATTP